MFIKKPFRRWFVKKIVKGTRERLMLFKYIQFPEPAMKPRILPQARHFEIQLARVDFWEDMIIKTAAFAIVAIAGLVFILAPLIVAGWIGSSLSGKWLLAYFLFYQVIAVLAYGLILALPAYLSLKILTTPIWFSVVLIIYLTALYKIFLTAGTNPPTLFTTFLASILLGEVSAIFAFFIYLVMIIFIRFISKKIRNALYPDAVFANELLQVVAMVKSKPRQWRVLAFKRQLMNQLEDAANCVQHNLPNRLRSGDAGTDAWLVKTANEIAAAVRAQKRMLLPTKPHSRAQFLEHVTNNLLPALSGNWDELEKATPEKIPFPQNWLARAAELLRVSFTGGIPLLLVWSIQQTPLALQGTLFETVTTMAILWAILTLLAAFDPLYSAKIVSLKDIVQFMPLLGKAKK